MLPVDSKSKTVVPFIGDLLGMPYRENGRFRDGALNCVGLVLAVLERAGFDVLEPDSPEAWEREQFIEVPLDAGEWKSIDVLHYHGKESRDPDHMAVYLVGGLMIHATEQGVRVDPVEHSARLFAVTRFCEPMKVNK